MRRHATASLQRVIDRDADARVDKRTSDAAASAGDQPPAPAPLLDSPRQAKVNQRAPAQRIAPTQAFPLPDTSARDHGPPPPVTSVSFALTLLSAGAASSPPPARCSASCSPRSLSRRRNATWRHGFAPTKACNRPPHPGAFLATAQRQLSGSLASEHSRTRLGGGLGSSGSGGSGSGGSGSGGGSGSVGSGSEGGSGGGGSGGSAISASGSGGCGGGRHLGCAPARSVRLTHLPRPSPPPST